MASSLDDISDEDLRSFTELQEDPESNDQIELYIYTSFLTATRMRSKEHLEQAIQRTEGWIKVTAIDHPDRARRYQILNLILTGLSQHRLALSKLEAIPGERVEQRGLMDDLDLAAEVANMAVDATPQDYPDRASCLNNLGSQFGMRYVWAGSIGDLNRAIEIAIW
jgi:hypothetical protein